MQIQIGKMIKQYREKNGISQENFAEILGVCKQAVSKWETGKNYPDMELLPQIATLLGCHTDDFFQPDI